MGRRIICLENFSGCGWPRSNKMGSRKYDTFLRLSYLQSYFNGTKNA